MVTRQVPGLICLGLLMAAASNGTTHAQESGGVPDGIHVRGDWVIEIRTPDGDPVARHEFRNALVAVNGGAQVGGRGVLAGFLGRTFGTVGNWWVDIAGANGPCAAGSVARSCQLLEPSDDRAASSTTFKNLVLSVPTEPVSFPAIGTREIPTGTLELSGQATAASDGSITDVGTTFDLCGIATNCFLTVRFTGHTLATPIPVSAGQIIQVKVVLSFS